MAADIGSIVAHLKLEMGEFTNNLNVAQQQVSATAEKFNGITSTGKALQGVGAAMTAGITVPVVALGKQAIQTGMDFQASMSKVKALSGATASDMEKLEATAREMGATTIYSAKDAADALGYMALAGWDANQSMSALPGVLNLAAASGMDLAQASDMVTDYLSAFGESADQAGRMADVLAYAQGNSNTTTEQLGMAFKNCAANANAFGLDIEQTTALLGKLSDQGLKGSEAGTALTATFRDITQKMKNGAIQIGNTSVKVQDANGNFRSMTDILTDVASATNGMGDAQKSAALMGTFTADSIKALNILLQSGSGNIEDFEKALRSADGTAQEMADTMNDNLKGDMAELQSAFEEMCLTLNEKLEPALRFIVQSVTNLVNWFSKLPAPILSVIMALAGFVALLGPLALIVGTVMASFTKLREACVMLKALFLLISGPIIGALETAMIGIYVFIMDSVVPALTSLWGVLMSNPIVLVITAIVALVAGFIYLWNNCEGFREFWINLWEIIKTSCMNAWNAVVNFFTTTMPQWFNSVIQWIQQLPGQIWYWLVYCVTYAALWVAQMKQKAIQAGIQFVQGAIQYIQTLPSRVWNWLVNTVTKAITWSSQMVSKARQAGKQFVSNVINFIQTLPSRVWTWLISTISKVINFVSQMGQKGAQAARTFVTNIVNGLAGLPGKMISIGSNIVSGIISGITGAASNLFNTMKNLASNAVAAAKRNLKIQSPSRVFASEVGKFIPEGISLGIETNADSVYKTLRNLSDNLTSNINVSDLMDSMNIRTSDININNKNSNAGLIENVKELIETVKSNSTIDYEKMANGFKNAVNGINNTIVMDKTVVGKMTAKTVNEENKIANKQQSRFRGELDYV